MKQVFANMGWLLGGRGFNAVLSLVYLAIAARTLGTEGFGHFALIIALGQAITGFSSFQTRQFIVRWGPTRTSRASISNAHVRQRDLLSRLTGCRWWLARWRPRCWC